MSRVIEVAIHDGLAFDGTDPNGSLNAADYTMLFWTEVPETWCAGGAVRDERKTFILDFILDSLYSTSQPGDWRNGNSDGSRYVILSSDMRVLRGTEAAAAPWRSEREGYRNWFCCVMSDSSASQVVECRDFHPAVAEERETGGDDFIAVGEVHRTLSDVEMLAYDYDSTSAATELLPSGSSFQPWKPLEHWRGEKVPITLGESHKEFDWGTTSADGHFIRWADFFCLCAPASAFPGERPKRLQARDERGRTPLSYAAERGIMREVEGILWSLAGTGISPQRLALIEVKDKDGLTAIDIARQNGHQEVADLLRGEVLRMENAE